MLAQTAILVKKLHCLAVATDLTPPFGLLLRRAAQFWRDVYVRPTATERGWSTIGVLRSGLLATVSWAAVLDPIALAAVVLTDCVKNYSIRTYIQTIRNMFLYGNSKGVFSGFMAYYLKRLVFNILVGFILTVAAFQLAAFTWAALLHVVTSRLLNSTHYIVGNVEALLIARGRLCRDRLAHIEGSLSIVGTVVAQMDLAGIRVFDCRPFWINIAISVALLLYYALTCYVLKCERE